MNLLQKSYERTWWQFVYKGLSLDDDVEPVSCDDWERTFTSSRLVSGLLGTGHCWWRGRKTLIVLEESELLGDETMMHKNVLSPLYSKPMQMFVANCLFRIGIQVGPSWPYPAPAQANKTPLSEFPLPTVVRKSCTTQKGIMALMQWGHVCMRYQNSDLYLLDRT